jgi:hemoglobin
MNLTPDHTPYAALGGEPGLRRLVDRFYALMDELPEAYNARRIHPESLDGARQGLFEFLSGWLGGPPLYVQRLGHPRLRMRHRPYAIGPLERDEWMLCMREALQEQVPDAVLRQGIEARLAALADHMVNTEARPCACDPA